MLEDLLLQYQENFHPVVPFESGKDLLHPFDFTSNNRELSAEQIADTELFARYIQSTLKKNGCRYGIGGYNEHRTLYARSKHFDTVLKAGGEKPESMEEPRRLHLGVDIWGPEGTRVICPMDGLVHSFQFNNNFADYGATIIISHYLNGESFHLLYGHLSLNSLKNLHAGKRIMKGEVFTEFGMRFENGHWPPHLHIQIIEDIGEWEGDYPGVCRFSEREQWLKNSPDPDLIIQMNQFIRR
jgi:murein DD-endopeptidase MepM/ murein hydrolase activator NlpD